MKILSLVSLACVSMLLLGSSSTIVEASPSIPKVREVSSSAKVEEVTQNELDKQQLERLKEKFYAPLSLITFDFETFSDLEKKFVIYKNNAFSQKQGIFLHKGPYGDVIPPAKKVFIDKSKFFTVYDDEIPSIEESKEALMDGSAMLHDLTINAKQNPHTSPALYTIATCNDDIYRPVVEFQLLQSENYVLYNAITAQGFATTTMSLSDNTKMMDQWLEDGYWSIKAAYPENSDNLECMAIQPRAWGARMILLLYYNDEVEYLITPYDYWLRAEGVDVVGIPPKYDITFPMKANQPYELRTCGILPFIAELDAKVDQYLAEVKAAEEAG